VGNHRPEGFGKNYPSPAELVGVVKGVREKLRPTVQPRRGRPESLMIADGVDDSRTFIVPDGKPGQEGLSLFGPPLRMICLGSAGYRGGCPRAEPGGPAAECGIRCGARLLDEDQGAAVNGYLFDVGDSMAETCVPLGDNPEPSRDQRLAGDSSRESAYFPGLLEIETGRPDLGGIVRERSMAMW